ncbi:MULTISPECIES: NAD(P)H-quinone oxidoreductase [unclassified Aureimonas]|uniref:NAD(P)H-quinone oxidoreductase n=1 Tax=unclassified Aureimonas TaxID=2615206 RepID=UPI0007019D9C|nr:MULTISPECIES: NAD(P)H-quinone oxidoreductase [unclassified Aureimonas]KQT52152.1 NAD(P)H-quinone oxidoreductase [Aureimonas sp. Leaf427]KQT70614.1 NAD(P)H-quinone oxidoreductase [Aureimonas sp. Leaf460]
MTADREMTAITIEAPGGPEVLKPSRVPMPVAGDGQVLIEVHAAGVNRPDVLQRLGAYPSPKGAPDWPGLEIAGTVVELGQGCSRYRLGDRVMALVPGGGYAEYAAVAEANTLPIPDGFGFVEAAAIPETFFTVWHNVFQRGGLTAGESFLVHGGTSGIGTTAIQLAAHRGAKVYATAGSREKCEAAVRLGATAAINYRDEDFAEVLEGLTGGHGIDVTLDMVGGPYTAKNLKIAAEDGRIVQIAYLKGQKVEIDLQPIMQKRLHLTGSTLRARSVDFKASVAREIEAEVFPLFRSGAVKPLIDTVYPLEKAADAHRHMDDDHIGKIVLTTSHHKG